MEFDNNKMTLFQIMKENIESYIAQGLTQTEIAKLNNVSQSSVSRVLEKMGKAGNKNEKHKKLREVIAYIEKHGGTIQNALSTINSDLSPAAVRKYAKQISFNYKDYRYAYRRYGKWLLLPGNKSKYVSDFSVDALCTGCNTVHSVSLCNLRSGKSKSCHECGKKVKNNYQVRRLEDGKLYRSIRSWAKDIKSIKQYSNLRTKIQKNQRLKVGEFTYSLETN